MSRNPIMAARTYQELIGMLNKAEGEAADGAVSVAELLTTKFSHHYPHIPIGRPGRFLETARRIAGPVQHQQLKGSARRSYMKRRWTPRTRNVTYLGECVLSCVCVIKNACTMLVHIG